MKYSPVKPAPRHSPLALVPTTHRPHYFEKLNNNLRMRYLTLKQRVNANDEMPLDQKKKALDQASRGYLELRQLAKELQYVCLRESIDESFTQGYETVITCQQLSLPRIKELLLAIKQSLEDQSSFFHVICKEMQRRQETMRRMLGYLRRYEELADLQMTAAQEPVGQGMPILYDLMSKIVDRMIEYRDTTLCLLERLADWRSQLHSIMTSEDEDQRQKVLRGISFQYNGSSIVEVLAEESARLAETPLNKFIPFRDEVDSDPLLLHPYKISALTDDRPLNRPPLIALFTMNRKYVQRLTRSQHFFQQQLDNQRNRTSYPEELSEYKVYSQIFSEKFYKKAVRRNHTKPPEPASLHRRFDTDTEDDILLPLIKSDTSEGSTRKFESMKAPITTLDTAELENPKPIARSRVRIKPAVPNFKRHKTEAEHLDEELGIIISNYIKQRTLDQNVSLVSEQSTSQQKLLEAANVLKNEANKEKKSVSMAGRVIELSIRSKEPDEANHASPSAAEIKKQEKPKQKRILSVYKYDIINYSPQSRTKLPPLKKTVEPPEDPSSFSLVNEEVQTSKLEEPPTVQQQLSMRPHEDANLELPKESIAPPLEENQKFDSPSPSQVLVDSITPQKPEPEVTTDNFELSQALLHDWQFQKYVGSSKRQLFYSVLEPTLTWDSYYVYQLRQKTEEEALAVLMLKRVRASFKNYHVLKVVMLSCASEELLGVILSKYKQKLLSYKSESRVVVQFQRERMQAWLLPALSEALFEQETENFVLTVMKPNLNQQPVKQAIQLQFSAVVVSKNSPTRPNFSADDVEPFSPNNFHAEGIQICLKGDSHRSNKTNILEFHKNSTGEPFFSQMVHTRRCKSLREINNFLEAYELEVFEQPQLDGLGKATTDVTVCAINQNFSLPFGYATIPVERSTEGILSYFIFNCNSPSLDLWTKETASGLEQMCMIKLQHGVWMYLYKCDAEEQLRVLQVFERKFEQAGRRRDRPYSKCLVEMVMRQLYGKLPLQQLSSEEVFASFFLAIDEDDLTYNSIDYNLTHKDMLYFYLPFVVGFCVEGDGQRYSLCEAVMEKEDSPQSSK